MSNLFAALSMDMGGEGSLGKQVETVAEEVDADWLQFVKPHGGVHVRIAEPYTDIESLPSQSCLLAVSNVWDLAFVGTADSVRIVKLSGIENAMITSNGDGSQPVSPLQEIKLAARPVWIRLAIQDRKLVVGTAGSQCVSVYDVKAVVTGKNLAPLHTFSDISAPLLNLLPNPSLVGGLPHLLLCLAKDSLRILNMGGEGQYGKTLEMNERCSCVAWSAKGKQFVAGTLEGSLNQYAPDGSLKATIPCPEAISDGNHYPTAVFWLENDLFLVTYNQKASAGKPEPVQEHKQYLVHRQPKITPPVYTYTLLEDILPNFGVSERSANHRHFAHLKNLAPRAKYLAVMSSASAADIAVMMADLGESDAQPPKWSVLRLEETARPSVPTGEETYDEATCLGLDFDLRSETDIKLPMYGGVQPQDLPPQPRLIEYTSDGVIVVYNVLADGVNAYDGMVKAEDISAASDVPVTPAPVSGPNAVQSATPATPASPSPFSAPAATSKSAFGGVKLPTLGGLGKPSGQPAFGSSAFGSPAFGSPASTSSPVSGSTAFGKPSFGTPLPSANIQPLSSASTTTAFGASAFGRTPSAFGVSAFGNSASPFQSTTSNGSSSTTSPFGASAFGGPSAFGVPVASPFGATNQTSAFGAASAFGKPPSASSTPMTELSQGSAFGASAFSNPSSFGQTTASGFSFGRPAQATTSSTLSAPVAASPFGTKSASPSGGSGWNASAFTSASAAASASKPTSSAFGSTAFSQPSPATESTGEAPTSAPNASDTFGFNGFGDVLGSASKHPESPSSAPASPTSPISPSSPLPASDNSAFSFIKPSKAASAFGNIAQTAAPSTQAPTLTNTPHSAFGPSAFGKPSGFGQLPATTSAFGGSAFGKSSPTASPFAKPVATTLTQEAPPITGGFGGFATANKGSAGGFSFGATNPANVNALEPRRDMQANGNASVTDNEASAKSAETCDVIKKSAGQGPPTGAELAEGLSSASSPAEAPAEPLNFPAASPASVPQSLQSTAELEVPLPGNATTDEGSKEQTTDESAQVSTESANKEREVERTADSTEDEVDAVLKRAESAEEKELREEARADREELDGGELADQEGEEEEGYSDDDDLRSEDEVHTEEEQEEEEEGEEGEEEEEEEEEEAKGQEDMLQEKSNREPEASSSKTALPSESTPVGGVSFGQSTSGQSNSPSTDAATQAKESSIGGFSFGRPTPHPSSIAAEPTPVAAVQASPFTASPSPVTPDASAPRPSPSPLMSKPGKVPTLGFRQPSTAPIRSSPLALPSSLPPATFPIPNLQQQGPRSELFGKPAGSSSQPPALALSASGEQQIATPSTPAAPQPKRPVNIVNAQTPTRCPAAIKPAVVSEPTPGCGLAAQYLSIYQSMVSDLNDLSVTADKVADYHAEVGYKPIEKPTREDLELAEFWYFGALEAFLEETNSLEAEVKKVKDVGIKLNEHVRKVVSTMSKANTKSEDCFRYMRASRDPEFGKRLRSRQLGPEQAENQQKLRAMSRATMERIEQLEAHVARCRKRISQERTGRVPLRPSALEHASRTICNIDQGVRERQDDLRDLAKRLKRVSVIPRPDSEDVSASGLRSLEGSGPVFDMSAAALSAEVSGREMKDTFLAAKRAPKRSAAEGDLSFGASSIRPIVLKSAVRRLVRSGPKANLTTSSSVTRDPSTPTAQPMATPANAFFGIAPIMSGLQHAGRAPSRNAPTTKTHVPAPKPSQHPVANGQAAMSPPKSTPNLFFAQSSAGVKPAEPRPPTFTGFTFSKK